MKYNVQMISIHQIMPNISRSTSLSLIMKPTSIFCRPFKKNEYIEFSIYNRNDDDLIEIRPFSAKADYTYVEKSLLEAAFKADKCVVLCLKDSDEVVFVPYADISWLLYGKHTVQFTPHYFGKSGLFKIVVDHDLISSVDMHKVTYKSFEDIVNLSDISPF